MAPQKKVASERPRGLLPRFHISGSDHLEHDYRDAIGRQLLRLRDAFTPSQPVVDPRMFAGRRDALESVIRALENRRLHIVIYGERGVGKTSLLRMLSLAARDARYIVVYLSCGAASEFSETFRTVAAEIPLLYHSGIAPLSSSTEAGSTLADILPNGKLTPRQFADAAAKIVGTRVLILMDEFDRAASPEFRREVAEVIKTLSDLSARLQLVVSGVAGNLLELIEYIPSIRRSISALRLAAMDEAEVRALIANGERNSGLVFEQDASDRIVEAAKGSPYLVNLLCHLAGSAALNARRSRVTVPDVTEALAEVVADLRGRFPPEITGNLDSLAGGAADRRSAEGTLRRKTRTVFEETQPLADSLRSLEQGGLLNTADTREHLLDSIAHYLQLNEVLNHASDPTREEGR